MKQITSEVTVKMPGVDGKDKEISKPVVFPEYETQEDVLGAIQGDPKNVEDKKRIDEFLSALNYGMNLKARAKVTAQIKTENQGPGVAIERMVKQIMGNLTKLNKPVDEAKIRARILANPDDYGIVMDAAPAADAATNQPTA